MRPDHPQRLAPPASPGALLKRLTGLHTRIRLREIAERDPAYLAAIRELPCLKCGLECCEAAHVRMASGAHGKASGAGKKPADRWALPLCSGPGGCHAEQHRIGEREFWAGVGISPVLLCQKLYAARGDLLAMRAVVMMAIAERGR